MTAPVNAGDVLAGKYRVDRVLGVGGMGVVVAATHIELDEKVALKFMLPEGFQNPESRARFLREARAAVKLKSEHVARVLDTGTLDTGAPYIVMEFLRGTDVAGRLQSDVPISIADVAEIVIQACDALAEAHSLGIVHRDLKPANLFLTSRPDGSPLVKVLDFGISKANSLGDASSNHALTSTSAMMGSPLYMSPEQIKSSKSVDHRADIWSLGIILYELLGGRVPFMSDTLGELMAQVLTEPPAPLADVRPDIPPALAALVDRCLAKSVNDRVQNVAELALGLMPFAPPRARPIAERIASLLHVSVTPSLSVQAATAVMSNANAPAVSTSPALVAPQHAGAPNASRPAIAQPQFQGTTGANWQSTSPEVAAPTTSKTPIFVGVFAFFGVLAIAGVVMLVVAKNHRDARDVQSATSSSIASDDRSAAHVVTSASAPMIAASAPATTTASASAAPVAFPSASPDPNVKSAATTSTPSSPGKKTSSKTTSAPIASVASPPPTVAPPPPTSTPTPSATATKKSNVLDDSY